MNVVAEKKNREGKLVSTGAKNKKERADVSVQKCSAETIKGHLDFSVDQNQRTQQQPALVSMQLLNFSLLVNRIGLYVLFNISLIFSCFYETSKNL